MRVIDIVVLIVLVGGALLWFSRTNLYRAHQRSSKDPGQQGTHVDHRQGGDGDAPLR